MKKFLTMLFFLGLTTTGFAQLVESKTYEGRSNVNTRTPGVISLTCSPAQRICLSVTRLSTHTEYVRLMVPDHGIDVIATPMGTVNGIPFDNLPKDDDEDPSEVRDYIITYEEVTEEI